MKPYPTGSFVRYPGSNCIWMAGGGSHRKNRRLLQDMESAGIRKSSAGAAGIGSKRMSFTIHHADYLKAKALGLSIDAYQNKRCKEELTESYTKTHIAPEGRTEKADSGLFVITEHICEAGTGTEDYAFNVTLRDFLNWWDNKHRRNGIYTGRYGQIFNVSLKVSFHHDEHTFFGIRPISDEHGNYHDPKGFFDWVKRNVYTEAYHRWLKQQEENDNV